MKREMSEVGSNSMMDKRCEVEVTLIIVVVPPAELNC